MPQYTPLYIVASPQPRIGKTLLARLLIEFLLANGHKVTGYDLNPREPRLAERFPELVSMADIADTPGQMALFDQLLCDKSRAVVIDLGYGLFQQFFAVVEEIGLESEARQCSIEPVVFFIADSLASTAQYYADLQGRLPLTAFVPVHNESTSVIFSPRDFPPSRPDHGVVRLPRLSPAVSGVIHRPKFSFRDHIAKQHGARTELHDWTGDIFTAFRELELRLLMGKVAAALRSNVAAAPAPRHASRP